VRSAQEILPEGTRCPGCGGSAFRKESDIIDVWFESGCSQAAVLGGEPELPWPADLYFEGGDQYRGWFHSSLLCAVGTRGKSPYRAVATSGWTLDPQGRATSKSLGNGIDPVEIANRLGAEIIRLWVASVDFQEDVTVSQELMERVAENYRKIRNTFRYILGNLHDFDPGKDALEFSELFPLDQYMLLRTLELNDRARKWYDEFQFHRIYHQLNEFCTVDLSAIYFAGVRDRLYTAPARSRARRSAQTAIWRIGEALVRLAAPLMSFTAEEIWSFLPPVEGRQSSVHLALFATSDEVTGTNAAQIGTAAGVLADFNALMAVRDEAFKALEKARQEKQIGRSEEAVLTVYAPESLFEVVTRYRDDLRFLLVVSGLEVRHAASGNGSGALHVEVSKAPGAKCERCWNYSTQVGSSERYPAVCERCLAALEDIEQEQPV